MHVWAGALASYYGWSGWVVGAVAAGWWVRTLK